MQLTIIKYTYKKICYLEYYLFSLYLIHVSISKIIADGSKSQK